MRMRTSKALSMHKVVKRSMISLILLMRCITICTFIS